MFRTYRFKLISLLIALMAMLVAAVLYSYKNTRDVLILESSRNMERNLQLFSQGLNSEWKELQRSAAIVGDDQRIQEYAFIISNFDTGQDVLRELYPKLYGWLPVDRSIIVGKSNQVIFGQGAEELLNAFEQNKSGKLSYLFAFQGKQGLEIAAVNPVIYKDKILGSVILTKIFSKQWFSRKQYGQIGEIAVEHDSVIEFSSIRELEGQSFSDANRNVESIGQLFKFYYVDFPADNPRGYKIWYGINITDVTRTLDSYLDKTLLDLSFGVIIILIMGWFVTRNFDKPLLELTALTKEIAEGKRPTIEKKDAHTEIEILKNQFSDMIIALQEKEDLLSKHRLHLEEIVQKRTSELELARDKAIGASKSKSLFVENMSHELRTPLNVIIGYSDMLLEDLPEGLSQKHIDDLKKISNSGRHLLGLINEILDLSSIESGKLELSLESFSISELIDDVVTSVEILARENNNEITLGIPEDLGVMYSDKSKIKQALFNILGNANKFTKDGKITVKATRYKEDNEEWIKIFITDTGIGIPREKLTTLFEPFTQVDMSSTKIHGGTGLGLAITKQFCNIIGGKVTVDSEINVGSIFGLYLPMDVAQNNNNVRMLKSV